MGQYGEDYIRQTIKLCKTHFRNANIKSESGFVLAALKDGYFKDEIGNETQKKEKKIQHHEADQKLKLEEEKAAQEKEQQILKLREKYVNDEFIQAVLDEHKGKFLYEKMAKPWEEKVVHVFLQAQIDKKLWDEFGKE